MPAHDAPWVGPSQPRSGALHMRAPGFEEGLIEACVENFENRARTGKEEIAAGEATRIGERQLGRRQSSLSGAMRTPRSSRIRPSKLKSAVIASAASGEPLLAPFPLPSDAAAAAGTGAATGAGAAERQSG